MKKEPSVFVHRKDLPVGDWVYAAPTFAHPTATFTCENCKHPHIRFVHPLKHKKTGQLIKVGCVCAGHFLQDYSSPELRENELKGWIKRRRNWPNLNWTITRNKNLMLKKRGLVIVVGRNPRGLWYATYTKDGDSESRWTTIKSTHKTPVEAKLAAFDVLDPISRGSSMT